MFKHATIFRITGHTSADALNERLALNPFTPCGPTQARSSGWVPPRGEANGLMVESIGHQWIMRLQTETRSVPAAAVKKALAARLDAFEKETGRRPKGKLAKELKEEVTLALMPQAFPRQSATTAWLDPKDGMLVIDTKSMSRADDVILALVESGPGIKVTALQTEMSPHSMMSLWLSDGGTGRADIELGRRCELKQPDGEKAAVRYVNKELDIDEVKQHIRQGMSPASLALCWDGRVSFTLTPSMTLERLKFLEVVFESLAEDATGFDADVAILTGELPRVVAALVDALGGERALAASAG